MVETDNRCPRCDGALESDNSASLTQWVFLCRCDVTPSLEELNDARLCSQCGKRIAEGRNGSLTQWVFGSSVCSCSQSSLKNTSDTPLFHNRSEDDSEVIVADMEPELSVDPVNFPSNRYKPLAKLGSGASGEVFLCRDRMLNKKVALKRLHQLKPEQLISFQNEARSTSSLQHSSIIDIRDFGATASGAPYMVMEYFAGENLDSFIRANGPLPWKAALRMTLKLSEALDCAHRNGIFHRDLKPENVLLSINDSNELDVRLIDFGIANYIKSNQTTTAQGVTLVGTPAYMSPDQASGLNFDARSEIYSLGCVLYDALTGRPPFLADTPLEALSMHTNKVPECVSNFADLPPAIDSLVEKCLKKNPDDRYQSMAELGQQIKTTEQATTGIAAGDSPSIGDGVDLDPRQRRNSSHTAILAVVTFIAGISIALGMWTWRLSTIEPVQTRLKVDIHDEKPIPYDLKQDDEIDKVVTDYSKKSMPSPLAPVSKLCDKAYDCLSRKKTDEAEKLFNTAYNECLKRAPKHPLLTTIRFHIAQCKMTKPSKYSEAEALLRQVLADPRNPTIIEAQANNSLAQVVLMQKRYAEAELLIKKCLNQATRVDAIQGLHASIFECYWQQKKYEKAEQLLKTILADKNSSFQQSQNLFKISLLLYEKRDPRYEEICRRALAMGDKVHPSSGVADLAGLTTMRCMLIENGKTEEAKPLLRRESAICQSEKLEPREAAKKLLEISSACIVLKMNDLALSSWDQAAMRLNNKTVPDDIETAKVLESLVRIYCQQGLTEKSLPIYQRAVSIFSKSESSQAIQLPLWMGDHWMSLREFENAKLYYETALANYKKQIGKRTDNHLLPDIQFSLAANDLALAQYQEAQERLVNIMPAITDNGQRLRCDFLLLVSYRFQFKTKEAESIFRKKRTASNLNTEISFHMACAYMEAGQFDKARTLFDKVDQKFDRRESPYRVANSLERAICCHLQNQDADAEKYYRQAVSIPPNAPQDHVAALFFLANFLETKGKSSEAHSLVTQAMSAIQSRSLRRHLSRVYLMHISEVFRRAHRQVEADRLMHYAEALEKHG